MPKLYLLRHGEARSDSPDAARELTAEGAAALTRLAEWAARAGIDVAEIRHSPRRRTEQTASIMAAHLKPSGGVREISGIAPNDDPAAFAQAIAFESEPLLIVSHLPFLVDAVSQLAGVRRPIVAFQPATLVALAKVEERFVIEWVIHPTLL